MKRKVLVAIIILGMFFFSIVFAYPNLLMY